jgi:hypothetical protein
MKQTAAVGGDMLVVTGAKTKKSAKLVIPSTEPVGGAEFLGAPHTSDPTFDAPVVLLEPVVFVCAGPMNNLPAQRRTDRASSAAQLIETSRKRTVSAEG